ncbi:MAG: hypothetical protein IJZ64_01570 [Ruminococcus sp.]|nr:hypothetical protein [Ruminococcus sp.]
MRVNPASEIFDIPKFYYFQSKNIFTGSKDNFFQYKIIPTDVLTIQIWHGKLCSMKAKIEIEQTFSMTQEGFDEMIKWLENLYQSESDVK